MNERWKLPPPEITALLDAPPTPWVLLSPDTRWLLFVAHVALPDLADIARTKLKLAGLRIDPATNARHQTAFGSGLALRERDASVVRRIALPDGHRVSGLRWSPDSRRVALTLVTERATELWILDAERAELARLATRVNAVFGEGFEWLGDGAALLATLVPAERAEEPRAAVLPAGPAVQDARGEITPLRTYQDLLASPRDEELFDHYATAELVHVDVASGATRTLAPRGIFLALDAAPDARHVLVTRVEHPYSYQHPVHGFPQTLTVLALDLEREPHAKETFVVRVPAAENIPIEGVRTGPRALRWHPVRPATLLWLEALDGGDPRREAAHRDTWFELDEPFTGVPRELVRLEQRASGLSWFADDERYLTREYDRDRRWTKLALRRRGRAEPLAVLDDRSVKDRYADPGGVLLRAIGGGRRVVREEDRHVLRASDGESPSGARPFLDRQELATGVRTRLFESAPGAHEGLYTIVDAGTGAAARSTGFITRHESPEEPPNLRLRSWGSETWRALTEFTDPTPALRAIRKELVTYRRADGVELSGTLYLPPQWNGERLPLVMWAYPRDYLDSHTAGQVLDTPHTFTRIGGPSQLVFALRGYAVLDDASMPIVGSAEDMNDRFVDQAVASARAAIEHLAARGVCDPARVGIGGHSYGAFMTAMLLAHSDLFRAGIARSGAYNRTLTPFGFQSERRTLWGARASYLALSPLLDADRIRAPLLLVHGADDANPGTHPLQSERLFQAIKGNGGVARLVSLPHEGHSYRARQSTLHVVAEMLEWFEQHVKPRA